MSRFDGKTIIVTGGAGGIGEATARALHAEGANVVIADLDGNRCEIIAGELGSRAVGVQVNVAKRAENERLVASSIDRFGAVHGAFLNAGIEGEVGPFATRSDEAWNRVFDINVHGVRWAMQALIEPLQVAGGGSILVTSSVAGLRGAAGLAPYCASKHALQGMMKSAAAELAPLGIRVNSLNPGPVDNRMMRSIEEQASPGHAEDVKAGFTARVPIGRYVTNEEVAHAALFLLSEQSSGVAGVSYLVDGGFTAQ